MAQPTSSAQRVAYSFDLHIGRLSAPAVGADGSPAPRLYGLIDAGQVHDLGRLLSRRLPDVPRHMLFQGKFSGVEQATSPVLLPMPHGDQGARVMRELSRLCEDVPALSFISSHDEPAALLRHLQDLLVIETDEGENFLLRLADTYAIASALRVSTPPQRARMLHGIAGWWAVDPREQLIELHALWPTEANAGPLPLVLSAGQMAGLVDASAVPITAAQLRQIDPAFGSARLAEQHDFVGRMSVNARQAGFGTGDDLVAWCSATLRAGERCFEHPLTKLALVEAALDSAPQRLATALGAIDEETWSEIRSWAHAKDAGGGAPSAAGVMDRPDHGTIAA